MAYKSISTTSNNNFVYYETSKESRKHDIAQHLITCLVIFPLREKSSNAGVFLVGIQENTDQKKLRIWTLFTQCPIVLLIDYFKEFFSKYTD